MSELLDHIQQSLGDRYLIERELGRGGMAFVYLARDRRYERQVAVKVLDPDIATAVGAERFLREIRITAQLQHPHIVPLLDSAEAGNLLYAVMPFVEGESLRDRLMAQARLPITEAVSMAWEVADALDYAHRRGVVHRDIKPENILVSNGHALVADFGIARAVGLAGGATLTGVGFPIGTAAYMSPEQATAASPVDGRSDIYSLGCVLYEMIAGRMAFAGPSLKSVLTQQLTVDPPLVHISRPDVPPAIIAIVRRCLMKQPDERYQTAGELAEDLRGALSELPRLSTPVPRPPMAEAEETDGDGLLTAVGRWIVPAALLAIVLLILMFTYRRHGGDPAPGAANGPYNASVAILPFDHIGGTEADAYLGEGITDEIINQLAQVESLKVISRTSVLALKNSPLTLPQIAETLGVRHIVEGAVRRQGNRGAGDGRADRGGERRAPVVRHLRGQSGGQLPGPGGDRAQGQRGAPHQHPWRATRWLGQPCPPRAPRSTRCSWAATSWSAVLRRRWPGPRKPFAGRFRADSGYAPAYAGLSSAYVLHVVYGFPGGVNPYVAVARALALADRAVQLDPMLADGYLARSDALLISPAPHDQVLRSLREARQLAPGNVAVYLSVAHALEHMGRWEAALQQAERGLALDPLSTGVRHSDQIAIALGHGSTIAPSRRRAAPGRSIPRTASPRCCWGTRCC